MCDISLNLQGSCWCSAEDRPSFGFPFYPASWKVLKVTKRLANSFVCTVMRKMIIASRFWTTRNLTCWGLLSGIQKFVVMKCCPCRESGVHLQRMSALKCVLLSPGRFRVTFFGFIQIISEVWIFQMVWFLLTFLVGGWFLNKLSMDAKIVNSGRQEEVAFLSSFEFFWVDFVTFNC